MNDNGTSGVLPLAKDSTNDAPMTTTTTTTTTTALDILRDLDDPQKKSVPHRGFLFEADPDDPACGKWGREQMQILKSAALSSKTVYAYCFVQSSVFGLRPFAGWCMVLISVIIQIVVPFSIVVLLQPVYDIDAEYRICPRRSNGLTKLLAFTLSAYFVVLTLGLCTNKLRGLMFLHQFVHMDSMRSVCIAFGIFAQCIGMFVASLCQFLLFIKNDDNYVALLLQSLAMQFCLTVDERIVSFQIGAWTAARLEAITSDELLATRHGGLGVAPNGPMPAKTLKCITTIVNSEKIVLIGLVLVGAFMSISLAVCM